MRSLLTFQNSIHLGATGIALVIVGVLLLGLLTIPAQTKARADHTSGSYSYYAPDQGGGGPALPSTGSDDLAGVGADAPLALPGGGSVSLPIVGAGALLALGVGSVGASFWLTRPSRRRA